MVAIALLITAAGIFAAGGLAGFILFVSVGIRREERRFTRTRQVSLTRPAPGPVSASVRSVNGVYVRQRSGTGPITYPGEADTGGMPPMPATPAGEASGAGKH